MHKMEQFLTMTLIGMFKGWQMLALFFYISRKDETENLINILIYVDIIHKKLEKEGIKREYMQKILQLPEKKI